MIIVLNLKNVMHQKDHYIFKNIIEIVKFSDLLLRLDKLKDLAF